MSGALALFVKTPGLSQVKTRLARDIGTAAAERLYLACADAVSELLQGFARESGVRCVWAIAEDDSLAPAFWAARGGLDWMPQGEGGLGARMARVHHRLVREHGFGLLIGADLPQLTLDHLRKATAWLRAPQSRQVLGAAEDGGFWLYGGNRTAPEVLWESVAYSQPRTGSEFRAALASFGDWLNLPVLCDLDTPEDLQRVVEALRALGEPRPAQRRVLGEIEHLLESTRHA
ncbi:MAG: TIGR04282 family arsenosugar biosynthesis glycosyltransferase [Aquimonas sp.]